MPPFYNKSCHLSSLLPECLPNLCHLLPTELPEWYSNNKFGNVIVLLIILQLFVIMLRIKFKILVDLDELDLAFLPSLVSYLFPITLSSSPLSSLNILFLSSFLLLPIGFFLYLLHISPMSCLANSNSFRCFLCIYMPLIQGSLPLIPQIRSVASSYLCYFLILLHLQSTKHICSSFSLILNKWD